MIQRHCEHTFDLDRVIASPAEWCIDIGCRGFDLPRLLASHGKKVLAVDADPAVTDPKIPGVTFVRGIVWHTSGCDLQLRTHPTDPNAATVMPTGWAGDVATRGWSVSIGSLCKEYGIEGIALLKLDCEGAEYEILRELSMLRLSMIEQISVEYHDHCGIEPPGGITAFLMNLHLKWDQFMDPTQVSRSVPPWGGNPSYWDCLYSSPATK